jgi:hypothetical protein
LLIAQWEVSDDPEAERDSRVCAGSRVRAVPDAPIDALLARADELARRWVIEQLLDHPLRQLAEVSVRNLARGAPALCEQVIRALGSDVELDRLVAVASQDDRGISSRAHALSVLARGSDARAAVREVEALRGVVWEASLVELGWPALDRPRGRIAVDLSDRLAYVCSTALSVILAPSGQIVRDTRPSTPGTGREQVLYSSSRTVEGRPSAVLVDERADAPRPSDAGTGSLADGPERESLARLGGAALDGPETRRRSEAKEARARPRPLPWDIQPSVEPAPRRPKWEASDSDADSDPTVRLARRPATPVDELP